MSLWSVLNLTGCLCDPSCLQILLPVYCRYTDLNAASLNLCSLQKPNKDEYHAITAYGTSKLCNLLFALELNRILLPVGVTCNVVHPGNLLSTNMLRNAGMFYNLLRMIVWPFVKSVVGEYKCMRTNQLEVIHYAHNSRGLVSLWPHYRPPIQRPCPFGGISILLCSNVYN